MAKKKDSREENLEVVQDALSKTEQYIEDNQKSLMIIVGAIIAIAILYLAYTKLYIGPKEEDALSSSFMAEQYFDIDSFRLALYGDGGSALGFLTIVEDYGMTPTGNLANYYAGICYLKMGEFDNAIEYLKSFDSGDEVISAMAYGALGDAYSEKGENSDALTYYMKAGNKDNDFTSPMFLMKAGLIYETRGEYADALKVYEKIKKDYKQSNEGRYINKYIQRATLNM
ncbi:MAG: tetratricopeptide repeat protein [Bacteroidota bacterium]|nr:tetratricopeptide repeat protein [Bacteroidota bacterium]